MSLGLWSGQTLDPKKKSGRRGYAADMHVPFRCRVEVIAVSDMGVAKLAECSCVVSSILSRKNESSHVFTWTYHM